jgi:hypothetical protein
MLPTYEHSYKQNDHDGNKCVNYVHDDAGYETSIFERVCKSALGHNKGACNSVAMLLIYINFTIQSSKLIKEPIFIKLAEFVVVGCVG